MISRCVNIDWLEVYCLEDPLTYPHDVDFFLRRGWQVEERDYGTRVYDSMFTLLSDSGEKLVEIRRNPSSKSGVSGGGILDPMACHIRLTNRTCYFANPADFMLQFCQQNGFAIQRISRIDIALDFERFDSGDAPAKFIQRYLNGRYAKINQTRVRLVGRDSWSGREFNSISWGSPTSHISTKLYLKTLELLEVRDKPYIRQAWNAAGLVDDPVELTKRTPKGEVYKPDIWRLEFSIKSPLRHWFVVEDVAGSRKRLRSIKHTLDLYRSKQHLLDVFFSLCDHYFHFKHVEYIEPKRTITQLATSVYTIDRLHPLASASEFAERKLQRKDRCTDKILWKPKEQAVFYKVTNVATAVKPDRELRRLLQKIQRYHDTHADADCRRACITLESFIEEEIRRQDLSIPWPKSDLVAIRRLMADRIEARKHPGQTPPNYSYDFAAIVNDIFGEG